MQLSINGAITFRCVGGHSTVPTHNTLSLPFLLSSTVNQACCYKVGGFAYNRLGRAGASLWDIHACTAYGWLTRHSLVDCP